MPINFDLRQFTKDSSIFIETGTYMGDGVQSALDAGFTTVYSIEFDEVRANQCRNRFRNQQNVTIIQGNSGTRLDELLRLHIGARCVFWLDAHYCADGAALADKWTPLCEELKAIKNHPFKNHTILVDDYRCMNNTHIDVKTQKEVGFPGAQRLLELLKEINPEYEITFLDGCIPNDVVCTRIQ